MRYFVHYCIVWSPTDHSTGRQGLRGPRREERQARQPRTGYVILRFSRHHTHSHPTAKEILAGFAGAFIDRELETRGVRLVPLFSSYSELKYAFTDGLC